MNSRGYEGPVPFFLSSFFFFSPIGRQTSKTRTFENNCICGGNEKVTVHAQERAQAENRRGKTLHLFLRLIPDTKIICNKRKTKQSNKQKTKQSNKQKYFFISQQTLGKGENLICIYNIIRFKCPAVNKIHKRKRKV